MKRFAPIALSVMALTAAAPSAGAEGSAPTIEIGALKCLVENETNFIVGSTATLGCSYDPIGNGPVEAYRGTVKEFGLDIGMTDKATLVWGVFAPAADTDPGALAGDYAGVTAGASLGAGLKANALVGGLDKSIALNPISIESQTGVNLTLGVSQLSLEPIR